MAALPDQPRIPPLPPDAWPVEMREAIAALRPAKPRLPLPPRREDGPKGLNVLGLLAQHPDLTRAFNTFNGHVQFGTTLTARQRELVILRVAAVRASAYEWAQHALLARDAGITADEIQRVARGDNAAGWSDLERVMLRAVDELIADALLSEETWTALAGELDEQQLMDLVFLVGCYDLLAMAFNSFGLQLDDDLIRLGADRRD